MRNFKVNVNGKEYSVQVEEVGGAQIVSAPVQKSAPAPVQQSAPAAPAAAKPAPAPAAGGQSLNAPLPGMIVDLKVANGATVKKGDIVLILEAMKMENDVAAPADGTITFSVQKGANVNTGDLLATIG